MKRFSQIRTLQFGLPALLLALVVVVMARPAAAQGDPWPEPGPNDAIGISAIMGSTDSSHIVTYSETEIGYNVQQYYEAYVEGHLFQNDVQIDAGSKSDPEDAHGYLSDPLTVGDTYEIDSYHVLAAYYFIVVNGVVAWENPQNWLGFAGGGDSPPGTQFAPGGGPDYYAAQDILLGVTFVWIRTGQPNITSMDPSSGSVETSGTITLQGNFLMDLFTQTTTPAITGTGMTISLQSVNDTSATLGYSISDHASTGAHNITLTTRFGTSNAMAFNVGDPTPVVTGVNPPDWDAGTTFPVTITGTGFGTNPTVTLTPSGVATVTVDPANSGDTSISANVQVAPDAQDQVITIEVTSNGYYGSGFVATNPGQSPKGRNTANLHATPAPPPKIMFLGNDVTGQTTQVVVGQQIALTTSVNLPPGLAISSQSWSVPGLPGSAVAGYTADQDSAQITQLLTFTNPYITLYWVQASGAQPYTVQYFYCMINNKCSQPVTAKFSVAAPGNVFLHAIMDAVRINPTLKALGLGSPPLVRGISFNAGADAPAGAGAMQTLQWVQLISHATLQFLQSDGVPECNPKNIANGPVLDNVYPLPTPPGAPGTEGDSPRIQLGIYNENEVSFSFTATTYLMWDPALKADGSGGCTPAYTTVLQGQFQPHASECASIPVPLRNVTWHWEGNAINTLDLGQGVQGWVGSCPTPAQPGTTPESQESSYPQWTARTLNGDLRNTEDCVPPLH